MREFWRSLCGAVVAAVALPLVVGFGSIWTDKSNAARTWSGPAGLPARSNLAGVGSGDVATLVADAPVTVTGAVPTRTATLPTASTRAAVWTIVLARAT